QLAVPGEVAVAPWHGGPRPAAEHAGVAGGRLPGSRRIASFQPADPEQATVAERERDHRRREILLVAVLVQPHAGVRAIHVDKARLRRVEVAGEVPPGFGPDVGRAWPALARDGRRAGSAGAARARYPAERARRG